MNISGLLPVMKVSLNLVDFCFRLLGKTSCFTCDKCFFELLVDFCFRLPGKTSCFTCDKGFFELLVDFVSGYLAKHLVLPVIKVSIRIKRDNRNVKTANQVCIALSFQC